MIPPKPHKSSMDLRVLWLLHVVPYAESIIFKVPLVIPRIARSARAFFNKGRRPEGHHESSWIPNLRAVPDSLIPLFKRMIVQISHMISLIVQHSPKGLTWTYKICQLNWRYMLLPQGLYKAHVRASYIKWTFDAKRENRSRSGNQMAQWTIPHLQMNLPISKAQVFVGKPNKFTKNPLVKNPLVIKRRNRQFIIYAWFSLRSTIDFEQIFPCHVWLPEGILLVAAPLFCDDPKVCRGKNTFQLTWKCRSTYK